MEGYTHPPPPHRPTYCRLVTLGNIHGNGYRTTRRGIFPCLAKVAFRRWLSIFFPTMQPKENGRRVVGVFTGRDPGMCQCASWRLNRSRFLRKSMPGTIEESGLCCNLGPGMTIRAMIVCAHYAGNKYLLGSQQRRLKFERAHVPIIITQGE